MQISVDFRVVPQNVNFAPNAVMAFGALFFWRDKNETEFSEVYAV